MVLTFVLYLTVFLNGLLSPVLRSIPWPLRWCNEGWLALELGNYSPVFLSFWHFWTQFLRSDYCRIHSLVMKLYILLLTDNPIKPWYLVDMLYLQVTELSIISVITVTAYICIWYFPGKCQLWQCPNWTDSGVVLPDRRGAPSHRRRAHSDTGGGWVLCVIITS